MEQQHILVVEDETDIAELMRYNLVRAGYRVTCVHSGEAGLREALKAAPDLVLLDRMLPGMDGLTVCRRLKAAPETQRLPVIMVTARGDDADVMQGLELGADDYVAKPFVPGVLLARVAALLRRSHLEGETATGGEQPVSIHGITIHPGRHEVRVNGKAVSLTPTEFGILNLLARKPGWAFTRYQIVDGVHGTGHVVTERSVDVQIASLRKKLGGLGEMIETVRGVGYRMKA